MKYIILINDYNTKLYLITFDLGLFGRHLKVNENFNVTDLQILVPLPMDSQ